MKKFLSMVLALVMAMSLVTVSAGAKDFNDSDKISDIAYEEAVNVMSEMGIIDGYNDGNFQPQGTLTRGAAAKIIACMMLGKTTAEALGTQAAPFKDVPVGSTFAGYIAYCVESGIIDGYSDGTFRPGNTLTGFAFLKMLLTALGYDSAIEGYANNANWTVNVAGRAKQVGLLDGNDEFVGTKAATREEACLYAVNALQATLVEYSDKGGSISVGDITINTGASNATYVTSNVYDAATSINDTTDNVKNGWTVEFAEKYQPDLALKDTTDVFGRPAHTWTWKKAEIGTYVEYDKMVGEYTEKITGRDLVDLLTKATIDDNDVFVYIDGEDNDAVNTSIFDATDMVKANTETIGDTGNGVLTQVFLDTVEDEITVAIINTYLAKAEEDYNEKTEDLDLTVFGVDNKGGRTAAYVKQVGEDEEETLTVEVEDFDIEGVVEDDLFLVTIADGAIQTMEAPEILSEASVDSFKLGKYVTADGSQYDYADTAQYDQEVLDKYDNQNMKDVTYNVILDPYGYLIGVELNEDPDQYVFLAGLDSKYSNLSVKEADANVIFVDGSMKKVTVNMTKSEIATAGKNLSQLNTWCTYTVNDSGVYTLKEVAGALDADNDIDVAQFAQDVDVYHDAGVTTKTIGEKYVSLVSSATPSYVYGNDETVYINVELENVRVDDRTNGGPYCQIIDDVESVTTGIKNVKLVMRDLANVTGYTAPAAEIYTLFGDDGYVIAAVTIGENEGTASNYVYVTSDKIDREALSGSEWAWTREAFVEKELKDLTEVGSSLDILDEMNQGQWYEVKYNADGNVRKAEAITFAAGTKFINQVAQVQAAVNAFDTVLLCDNGNLDGVIGGAGAADDIDALTFDNGTLYTNTDASKGFSVSANVTVLLALDDFDETEVYTGYDGLKKALRDMNANNEGFQAGTVEVSAILETPGSATVIVINDTNPDPNAWNPGTPNYEYTPVVTQNGTFLNIKANTDDGDGMDVYTAAWNWLVNNGYSVVSAQKDSTQALDKNDNWTFFVSKNGQSTFFQTVLTPMAKITVNNSAKFYADGDQIAWSGDYWMAYRSGAYQGVWGTATKHTVVYADDNGKLSITDGLYQATVNGTPAYYKIGASIPLVGSQYSVNGAAYEAIPSGGVTMKSSMANKTINSAWKVTVTTAIGTETVYVADNGTTALTTALTVGTTYKTDDGRFVTTTNPGGQIANVKSDITISNTTDTYTLVNGLSSVVTGAADTTLTWTVNGVAVTGSAYVKTGDVIVATAKTGATGETTGTATGKLSGGTGCDVATVTSTYTTTATVDTLTAGVVTFTASGSALAVTNGTSTFTWTYAAGDSLSVGWTTT